MEATREVHAAASANRERILATEERSEISLKPGATPSMYAAIFQLLLDSFRLDASEYRFSAAGTHIIQQLGFERAGSLSAYLEALRSNQDERDLLYEELFVGSEAFLGDIEAHQVLIRSVLPDLIANLGPDDDIRVWVVGCGKGEEAYAIGMMLHETLLARSRANRVRIFATDVHPKSLSLGKAGVYSAESMAPIPKIWRDRYVREVAGVFKVTPEIRDMITFAEHNVLRDPPLLKLDLIVCRNLLTLLEPTAKKRVLSLFHIALNPEGVLFLAPNESITQREDDFEPLDPTGHTFRNWRSLPFETKGNLLARSTNILPHPDGRLGRPAFSDRQLVTILDSLLSRYIHSGFVIGDGRELLYSFGKAADLLTLKKGKVSTDVLALVPPELRSLFVGAFAQIKDTGQSLQFDRVSISVEEGITREFSISVRPFAIADVRASCVLVLIEERLRSMPESFGVMNENPGQVTPELKGEFSFTRDALLNTVEELEAVNDQLHVTHQELQIAQEELSSLSEELKNLQADSVSKSAEFFLINNDLENLLDGGEVDTLFLDKTLRVRRISRLMAERINISLGDFGRPFETLGPRFHGPVLKPDLERVLREGVVIQHEYRDDGGKWFRVKLRPYKVRDAIDGVVLTMVDFSSIREGERETRKWEACHKALMESIEAAVWSMDEVGAIRQPQPSWEVFTGQSWGEPRGFGWVTAIAEGDRAQIVDLLSREPLESNGEPLSVVVWMWRSPYREYRVCTLRLIPVEEDVAGERGWLAAIVDNHELHLTRQRLAEADMIRHVVNESPFGIVVQDPLGRYCWANRHFVDLIQIPVDEIEGKTDYDLFPFDVAEMLRNHHVEVLKLGKLRQYEEALPPPVSDGKAPRTFLVARYPMKLPDAGMDGVATVSVDITERKRIEEQAQAGLRQRDSLMATIAHEIRNPLHAIASAITVIRGEDTAPEARQRAILAIARQSQQVGRLVDDLMTMTRSKQDKLRFHRRPIDLRPTIESALDQNKLDLEAKHQSLSVNMPDEPIMISGDDERLRQLVANLVDNASKYSPESGRIFLELRREAASAVLSITDEGQGIATDQLALIFRKYAQTDAFAQNRQQGVGLGLWVVQEIARQHGGAVIARSNGPGCGSEFIVTLPLLDRVVPLKEASGEVARKSSGDRILLVDDNSDASEMLRIVLQAKGFEVEIVSNGEKALEQLQENSPVAALVDIGLPDMSGLEVARRLRAEHPNHLPMMIAISGYGEEEDKQAAREAGFDAYLTKPVRVEDVVALLQ